MPRWRSQLYEKAGRDRGINHEILARAVSIGEAVVSVNPSLPPIFSLRHLTHLTKTTYGTMRAIASRTLRDPYKIFRIRKRPAHSGEARYRTICIPSPDLMRAQRWIAQRILAEGKPHSASVAYSKGDNIVAAAQPHCDCRWLIKIDVRNFFESINEIAVYRVFRSFRYEPLVAFELSRICTRLGSATRLRSRKRWKAAYRGQLPISAYWHDRMGHLPQGAPTSPMLANLAMHALDKEVTQHARKAGFIYTRYADDLTFSTKERNFTRRAAAHFIGEIYAAMARAGLSPNVAKTRISTPGSRKVVLGLLVDGAEPKLSREFKANLRRHLHYLGRADIGPSGHALARGFDSVIGLRRHVEGLVSYAHQVDPTFAAKCTSFLEEVDWPV